MALSLFIAPVAVLSQNIVGAGTTTLKAGTGILHRVVINAGGTSAAIFDNTTASGKSLGTLNLGANFPTSVQYQAPFLLGLTIQTVGAPVNLTVVYE